MFRCCSSAVGLWLDTWPRSTQEDESNRGSSWDPHHPNSGRCSDYLCYRCSQHALLRPARPLSVPNQQAGPDPERPARFAEMDPERSHPAVHLVRKISHLRASSSAASYFCTFTGSVPFQNQTHFTFYHFHFKNLIRKRTDIFFRTSQTSLFFFFFLNLHFKHFFYWVCSLQAVGAKLHKKVILWN